MQDTFSATLSIVNSAVKRLRHFGTELAGSQTLGMPDLVLWAVPELILMTVVGKNWLPEIPWVSKLYILCYGAIIVWLLLPHSLRKMKNSLAALFFFCDHPFKEEPDGENGRLWFLVYSFHYISRKKDRLNTVLSGLVPWKEAVYLKLKTYGHANAASKRLLRNWRTLLFFLLAIAIFLSFAPFISIFLSMVAIFWCAFYLVATSMMIPFGVLLAFTSKHPRISSFVGVVLLAALTVDYYSPYLGMKVVYVIAILLLLLAVCLVWSFFLRYRRR